MATLSDSVSPVVVVAVSGASRSGKTILIDKLYNELVSDVDYRIMRISQDWYFFGFHTITATIPELKRDNVNWDDPRALNWDKFYENIVHLKGTFPVDDGSVKNFLFVEGFMCFYEERLRKLFDVMVWLEIDQHTCFKRRMSTSPVTTEYFHTNLWTNYSRYRDLIFKEVQPSVTVVDGRLSREDIYAKVTDLLGIRIK